jgi:hypothetical protein
MGKAADVNLLESFVVALVAGDISRVLILNGAMQ